MFRRRWWLFGKTISDEGFSISFTSRTTLIYELDGRSMIIQYEGDLWPNIDIFHYSMKHWANDGAVIDEKSDEKNIDNVTRALEWLGFIVRIVT